jgi:hypothetical protein
MKQTAVEWLHNQLHLNISLYQDEWQIIEGLMEEAKEKENEQIKDAYNKGEFNQGCNDDAEQYYNETFKQQEQ